jgi:hypothetical protein
MKPEPNLNLDRYRTTHPLYPDTPSGARYGVFIVAGMKVIASDGMGWEHVSVSRKSRCPTWDEMCQIKNLFWDENETVIQFHPPKTEYVNNHPYCLHLWKPTDFEIQTPPSIFVGTRDVK